MHLLTAKSFEILTTDLQQHGNKIGDLQRAALLHLLDAMTDYALGTKSGRNAFGLATGTGKTSAVIAWIAALYHIDMHGVSVSVSASKVEALCDIKRALIAHGVPEHLIGLKHSLGEGATEPSTGNDDRRYQLITHARVRGGIDHDLFVSHQGAQRAVMIYDESMFRSDTFAVSEHSADVALAAFKAAVRGRMETCAGVLGYLSESLQVIQAELESLKQDSDATERVIELGKLSPVELDGYRALVEGTRMSGFSFDSLSDLLQISQEPLRIIRTGQHDGAIWYKLSVPEALRNVLILDASTPIRDLIHLDKTIHQDEDFRGLEVKRYDQVRVFQMLAPGGRTSMTSSFKAGAAEKRGYSREVVEVVKSHPNAKGILLFTFKKRDVDFSKALLDDLKAAGIDTSRETPAGKPWLNALTWGDETSLNRYSHCDVVIMCGVLHRSHLDLSAAVVGQADDLSRVVSHSVVEQMLRGEIAHLIYQGASRGSCRITNDGQAGAMSLYLIHKDAALQTTLKPVMPGAQWAVWEPKYLKDNAESKESKLALQILEYLGKLPEEVRKVSTSSVKKALELPDSVASMTWTRAVRKVSEFPEGWTLEGRSFERTFDALFGAA